MLEPRGGILFRRAIFERVMRMNLSRLGVYLGIGVLLFSAASFNFPLMATGQSSAESVNDEIDTQLEYNVKLAYLYNFGRYLKWPSNEGVPNEKNPWVIGILGDDPFGKAAEELASGKRNLDGRPIVIKHFSSIEEYQPCNVLFLVRNIPQDKQEAIIQALHNQPVLVVGEVPGFADKGGCVNFFRDGTNVRFEINVEALNKRQIQASSKLLGLARIVSRPTRPDAL